MSNLKIKKEFGRIKQASEATGLSVSHIWQLIKENKIKSYLPSPKVRLIDFQSLIDYIKNNNSEVENV